MSDNARIISEVRLLVTGRQVIWCVLSPNYREVLSEHTEFTAAYTALQEEIKREKLSCGTGGCED